MESRGEEEINGKEGSLSPRTSNKQSPLMAGGQGFDLSGIRFSPPASPSLFNLRTSGPVFDKSSTPCRLDFGTSFQRFMNGEGSSNEEEAGKFDLAEDFFQAVQSTGVQCFSRLASGQMDASMNSASFAAAQIQVESASSIPLQLPGNTPTARALFPDGVTGQEANNTSFIPMSLEQMQQALLNLNKVAATLCSAVETLTTATNNVAEMTKKMSSPKASAKKKLKNGDGPEFNWMLGHGAAPKKGRKATADQAKLEKVRALVRANSTWFIYVATEEDLQETWIHFGDKPAAAVDGHYIKSMLMLQGRMSEDFANIVFRILRYDEADKLADTDENCHYVLHYWAAAVMDPKTSPNKSEEIFLEPAFHYDLANCGKVAAMVKDGDDWASLSIDFNRGITNLIHPAMSEKPYEQVLEKYKPMMHQLTVEAARLMKKLANRNVPDKVWEYDIALKKKHVLHGPDSGISTAFISIPKSNQFLPVKPETMHFALMTFVHSGVKVCWSMTKLKVHKAKKPPVSRKRDSDGKLLKDPKEELYLSALDEHGSSIVDKKALSYLP